MTLRPRWRARLTVLASAFHADDRAERIAIALYGGTAIVIDRQAHPSIRRALGGA